MTVYRQDANPNATNSELDAKVVIKHPQLTSYYNEGSIYDLKEDVDNFDEELYDELVENIQISDLMKEVNSGE